MLIGKDKIREVVERTDLVALIGRHVHLKRAGRSFVGLCPFHGERSPSFYVTPERRSYKCFGCNKGGDAIRFLMEYEGKDFVSAVRELAQQAGVPLVFDPEEDRRLQERRELLWACDVAARFFEEVLWSEAGDPGRAHLQQRGVSDETARLARLGYAPAGWQGLRDRLHREGVSLEAGVTAGLLGKKDERYYDTFRGRLMVPIRDPEGRVIAFGGRVVEGDDPRKYINSRETPLYTKSRVLYGMDTAREAIRKSAAVTLVEGYFDAIALREAGIGNVVALCSTVLTPEHMKLLERLEVGRVDVLLDGDEAGRRGAVKLAGPLLSGGVATRVIALPDGHDPDTFLRDYGRQGYDALVEAAVPLSSFVIGRALGQAGEAYEEKVRALAELRPVVAALTEGAPRSLFLAEVARQLGVGPADVASFFRGDIRREEPQQPVQRPPMRQGPAQGAPPARRGPSRAAGVPAKRRELELVANLLAYPALRAEFGPSVAARIGHADLRELTGLLVDGALPEEELLPRLDQELAQALAARVRVAWSAPEKDLRREIEDGLLHVDLERLQEERRSAIAERERLELQRLRSQEGTGEFRELTAAIQECRAQAEALREEMERLRAQLRGAA